MFAFRGARGIMLPNFINVQSSSKRISSEPSVRSLRNRQHSGAIREQCAKFCSRLSHYNARFIVIIDELLCNIDCNYQHMYYYISSSASHLITGTALRSDA
jgi:hypothetical protein